MEIQNLDVYAAKLSLDCVAECDDEAAKDDGQNIKNGSDAPRKTGASLDCCSVREYNASLSERLWAIQNLDVYAAEPSLDCVAECGDEAAKDEGQSIKNGSDPCALSS